MSFITGQPGDWGWTGVREPLPSRPSPRPGGELSPLLPQESIWGSGSALRTREEAGVAAAPPGAGASANWEESAGHWAVRACFPAAHDNGTDRDPRGKLNSQTLLLYLKSQDDVPKEGHANYCPFPGSPAVPAGSPPAWHLGGRGREWAPFRAGHGRTLFLEGTEVPGGHSEEVLGGQCPPKWGGSLEAAGAACGAAVTRGGCRGL